MDLGNRDGRFRMDGYMSKLKVGDRVQLHNNSILGTIIETIDNGVSLNYTCKIRFDDGGISWESDRFLTLVTVPNTSGSIPAMNPGTSPMKFKVGDPVVDQRTGIHGKILQVHNQPPRQYQVDWAAGTLWHLESCDQYWSLNIQPTGKVQQLKFKVGDRIYSTNTGRSGSVLIADPFGNIEYRIAWDSETVPIEYAAFVDREWVLEVKDKASNVSGDVANVLVGIDLGYEDSKYHQCLWERKMGFTSEFMTCKCGKSKDVE